VDGLLGAELSTEDLYGAVGDHLVRVHVGRGTTPRLEDVEDELVVEPPVHDLFGGLDDGVLYPLLEEAELVIHVGGFELYRP
jgi:hypothetical protein